tara:strand:- start:333 stop:1001 length:669 start_codon:yes stop_codon:yes gene_type:complete
MMEQKNFIHADKSWTIEELSAIEENGKRLYDSPAGKLPSVTTVTGWEKRKFFAKWRRDNPTESKRVLVRGSLLHEIIEDYLNNKDINLNDIPVNETRLFLNIKPVLDNIDNIYELEVPLWSHATMLAGRADCIAEYNGKLSVIDFKGSTKPKKEQYIDNYFQQATAYAIAWQERTNIPINNFVIMITCEDGSVQVFEKNPVDYTRQLLETIENYHESVSSVV